MKVTWIIIGLEHLHEYHVKMESTWMSHEKRDYMNVICKKYLNECHMKKAFILMSLEENVYKNTTLIEP